MSGHWLDAIVQRPSVEIVGLVDVREEAAQARAREFGLEGAYVGSDVGAAIDARRPRLVLDCTPPGDRVPVVLRALRGGCHVLSEKPMALTMAGARLMIAEASRAERLFAIAQNHRYMPAVRRFARVVRSGVLGPLTSIHTDFFVARQFTNFRASMDHALLLDMAVHTFDTVRFATGLEARTVYCREWNPPGSAFAGGAEAVAVFDLSSDVVFTYRGSWCAPGHATSWQARWRVIGQHATAAWNGDDEVRVETAEGEILREPSEDPNALGKGELLDDVLAAIEHGHVPPTDCRDNLRSLAMVHAAIESARTGRCVSVEAEDE